MKSAIVRSRTQTLIVGDGEGRKGVSIHPSNFSAVVAPMFRRRFSQANVLAWYGKKLNVTRQKHAFANQKKCTATQNKHKKLKPGLVALTTSGLQTEQVYSQRKR